MLRLIIPILQLVSLNQISGDPPAGGSLAWCALHRESHVARLHRLLLRPRGTPGRAGTRSLLPLCDSPEEHQPCQEDGPPEIEGLIAAAIPVEPDTAPEPEAAEPVAPNAWGEGVLGVASFHKALSGRATCPLCNARIPQGAWRSTYRFHKGTKINAERYIHAECLVRAPVENREHDREKLAAWFGTAPEDGVAALVRATNDIA